MVKYEFNRNEFNWAEEFFDIIKNKMELPEWFGKNADALWDMLTGYVETPCEITLIGFDRQENRYNEYTLGLILNVFRDAANHYPDRFKIILKNQNRK